jgi:hypothetical protein
MSDVISSLENQIKITRGLIEQAENQLLVIKNPTGAPQKRVKTHNTRVKEKIENRFHILYTINTDKSVCHVINWGDANNIGTYTPRGSSVSVDLPHGLLLATSKFDKVMTLRVEVDDAYKAKFQCTIYGDEDKREETMIGDICQYPNQALSNAYYLFFKEKLPGDVSANSFFVLLSADLIGEIEQRIHVPLEEMNVYETDAAIILSKLRDHKE